MTDEAMSPLRRRMSEDAPQASAEDAARLHSHDQEFRGVSRSLAGRGDLRGCTAFRLTLPRLALIRPRSITRCQR
jgi:hypothetical protein